MVNLSSAMPPRLLDWQRYCPWSYLVNDSITKPFFVRVFISATMCWPVERLGWNHLSVGVGLPVVWHRNVTLVERFARITVFPTASTHGGSNNILKWSFCYWNLLFIFEFSRCLQRGSDGIFICVFFLKYFTIYCFTALQLYNFVFDCIIV